MISRREWLRLSVGSGAVLALNPRDLHARVMHLLQQQMITRAIPSTGERLPIIGLGSSATFSQVARSEDVSALDVDAETGALVVADAGGGAPRRVSVGEIRHLRLGGIL